MLVVLRLGRGYQPLLRARSVGVATQSLLLLSLALVQHYIPLLADLTLATHPSISSIHWPLKSLKVADLGGRESVRVLTRQWDRRPLFTNA